jgi:hypothetical protein
MADEMSYHEAGATEATNVVRSLFCAAPRSKKYFMLAGLATAAEDYLDASDHCWCRVTQQVTGPDGRKARPDRCGPGRECYESAV